MGKPRQAEAPGLKRRQRADGTVAYYWVAASVSRSPEVKKYPQKTMRLFGTPEEIAQLCVKATDELNEWLDQNGIVSIPGTYDGTLRSLVDVYRRTPESPYHGVKHNTRRMYDESLDLLIRTVAKVRLDEITGLDFRRWYENYKKPAEAGKPERVRRAYKAMQLLRIIVKFGAVANISECFRLRTVLEDMRFTSPPARTERITFEQVQLFCTKAIEKGRLSMALAQAMEFELTLRQVDVIGHWEPASSQDGGIIDRGQRWSGGALWSHLDENGVFQKKTTKRGQIATHDTTAYPYLVSVMDRVPQGARIGPMVRDEASGLPYRYRHYARWWRKIATECGIPLSVWNRDSRAGGVTEGSDAGADIEHLRHHATHANISTTGRYNRNTVEKTRKVAELRVAHRGGKND